MHTTMWDAWRKQGNGLFPPKLITCNPQNPVQNACTFEVDARSDFSRTSTRRLSRPAGNLTRVKYGGIGTPGSVSEKEHADDEAATKCAWLACPLAWRTEPSTAPHHRAAGRPEGASGRPYKGVLECLSRYGSR